MRVNAHHLRQTDARFGENGSMQKAHIGQILKKCLSNAMLRRGVNQQRLSELTGLSISTISEIRHGISSPTLDTIARLADALGIETWELLMDSAETRRRIIERTIGEDPQETEQHTKRRTR